MSDKGLIITICSVALFLVLVGACFKISTMPKTHKLVLADDITETKIDNDKYDSKLYNVKVKTVDSEDENISKINVNIKFKINGEEIDYTKDLMFNKNDETFINEEEVNNELDEKNNETLTKIVDEVIEKIINEKSYKMNVSYNYSSSFINSK